MIKERCSFIDISLFIYLKGMYFYKMEKVELKNLYIVEITETLNKLVAIESDSTENALRQAEEDYDNGIIRFSNLDYVKTDFSIYEYSDPIEVEYIVKEYLKKHPNLVETLYKGEFI